jgi:hypothetical protein
MIELTKDKIIHSNHYNPECELYVREEVSSLWPFLEDVIKLSDDFTLLDLFNLIAKEKDVFDIIFYSSLGGFPLQAYLDDIAKDRSPDDGDEIDYLEVYRSSERWDWGDIDISLNFHGVSIKEDIGYAIEYTPLSDLKHLPLRINTNFEIGEVKKEDGHPWKWHVYTKGKVDVTVYELIHAVLFEVSFCGDPVKRDARREDLFEQFEEIKEEYKEHPERFEKLKNEDNNE